MPIICSSRRKFNASFSYRLQHRCHCHQIQFQRVTRLLVYILMQSESMLMNNYLFCSLTPFHCVYWASNFFLLSLNKLWRKNANCDFLVFCLDMKHVNHARDPLLYLSVLYLYIVVIEPTSINWLRISE